MTKRIIFLILFVLFFLFALMPPKSVETTLTNAFFNKHSDIARLAELSSNNLNVIIESDTLEGLEDLKSQLPEKEPEDKLLSIYSDYPINFLTPATKKLLLDKEYTSIDDMALRRLYNPMGFYVVSPDKDPYLFATDFLNNLMELQKENEVIYRGKYYFVQNYKLKDNKEIEKFYNLAGASENIYLTGTPIHSYITSKKCIKEINIICIFSVVVLILLCKFYFRTFYIIIPIGLSILWGFLLGYAVASLIFENLHVLTFVFSTTLIGISLDYSLHYFYTAQEIGFKKSLTASMLTTILAFFVLFLSNIELLRQISVFTAFGLIGVYLFVLFILPMFKISVKCKNFDYKMPSKKICLSLLCLIFCVICHAMFHVKFNDNIQNLYTPPKNLEYAESLFRQVFNFNIPEYILIKGDNLEDILQQEENLNIKDYIGMSKFISSQKRQVENIALVHSLYQSNLKQYAKFLSDENIQNLQEENSLLYNVEEFPLKDDFMLDKNTSYILTFVHTDGAISPSKVISDTMCKLRIHTLKLLPLVFCIIFVFLSIIYGMKKAILCILPSCIGALFAISLLVLCRVQINFFHILAMFLVIGFSLDYSIFRINSGKCAEGAVFISAMSTVLSFLLLSCVCFKLISSIGITVFIGVLTSYLISVFMIKSKYD